MIEYKNKRLIEKWKTQPKPIMKLFREARHLKHYDQEMVFMLDNYSASKVTGEKSVQNKKQCDCITFFGKKYTLFDVLNDTLGKEEVNSFLKKFAPECLPTPYQKYCKVVAEHALNILKHPDYYTDEQKKVFRDFRDLKVVLVTIWEQAYFTPLRFQPTIDRISGVVQPLSINQLYSLLPTKTKNKWHTNSKKPTQLINILNILIIIGGLGRIRYEEITDAKKKMLDKKFDEKFFIPTFYVCYENIENINWKTVLDYNLDEKTVLYPDAVREMFGDDKADKLIPITGQPNRKRLELTAPQLKAMADRMSSQSVTTYDELLSCLKAGSFGNFKDTKNDTITSKNFKSHLKGLDNLGWFESISIEVMTASQAKKQGYETDKKGKTLVYVNKRC